MPTPARPDRVLIGNLETGESLNALYNPDKVSATIDVNFTRLSVPGLSHQILQFINTNNIKVTMDLGFDGLSSDFETTDGDDMRNFLHSLLYQSKDAQTVATGSTPRVLLFWPKVYELVCKVTTMQEDHSFFDTTMASAVFVVKLTLEEARDTRLFSEDVRRTGTIRSGQ